jgi:hypothetical protein
MEANQALISLSGSREDLDIEVDNILGKSVWSINPLLKRKEIYNTLQKIYRTDQDRLLEQPSCHWRQIILGRNLRYSLAITPALLRGAAEEFIDVAAGESIEARQISSEQLPSYSVELIHHVDELKDVNSKTATATSSTFPSETIIIGLESYVSSTHMTEVQQMDAQEEREVAVNDAVSSSQPFAMAEDVELINEINIDTSNVIAANTLAFTYILNYAKMLVVDHERVVCIRKHFNSVGEYLRKTGK